MNFFAFERVWLRGIFACVIPSGASQLLPEGASDVPMAGFIDDLIAHAPAKFLIGLRACVWAVTLAPLLVFLRPRLFHQLTARRQLELLDHMRQSDVYLIREMPLLFKTIGCLGYGGVPEVRDRLGIARPRRPHQDGSSTRQDDTPEWAGPAAKPGRASAGRAPSTPEAGS